VITANGKLSSLISKGVWGTQHNTQEQELRYNNGICPVKERVLFKVYNPLKTL